MFHQIKFQFNRNYHYLKIGETYLINKYNSDLTYLIFVVQHAFLKKLFTIQWNSVGSKPFSAV